MIFLGCGFSTYKYTSESGVMSALIDKPTHIHITDELGMQLESANKDKGSAYRDISKIEMECFGRLHGTLHPVGYSTAGMTVAQKSELASRKVKNPALTIMAMTTPDTFYDAIGSICCPRRGAGFTHRTTGGLTM